MERQAKHEGALISPLAWSVGRRLMVAAVIAGFLWCTVGWALEW